MAANMKAVKLRMKSIQSTMQITKAMELVASSKLRKAKEQADLSRPYFQILRDTMMDIAINNTDFTSLYTKEGKSNKWCYVVIAGDRGLAGGYNSNLFKLTQNEIVKNGGEYTVFPIGKKAVEYYRRRTNLVTEAFAEAARVSVSDCFEIAKYLSYQYRSGEYGHIALCYTSFHSMLSQKPGVTSLLPLSDFVKKVDNNENSSSTEETAGLAGAAGGGTGGKTGPRALILYEPDGETVFNAIVPEYLAGLIHSAVCDSLASELAARRTAMESATKNAGEMIEQLELYYNRARQASITQEITEIVAGAEES